MVFSAFYIVIQPPNPFTDPVAQFVRQFRRIAFCTDTDGTCSG